MVKQISNKNHRFGCKVCEFCNNDQLTREQMPEINMTVWTCESCNSDHYWLWNNNKNTIE